METIVRPPASSVAGESLRFYLPALDGLRFFAFFLVLISHSGIAPDFAVLRFAQSHGWIGVELFFAISSFLFFHLLAAEDAKAGAISIVNFYIRRLLRLYPLMVAFPIAMLVIFGGWQTEIDRVLGIAVFSDNFLCWLAGFNTVPFSKHLWTLSYEFQIYMVIPLLFLMHKSMRGRHFVWVLLMLWVIATGARAAFIIMGAHHPLIWVTPFLRPESTLLGIALSVGLLSWSSSVAMIAAAAALVLLTQIPNVVTIDLWLLVLYPACAIICGSALWFAVHSKAVAGFLSHAWLVYLGKISFGLYVYHILAINLAHKIIGYVFTLLPGLGVVGQYLLHTAMALAVAVGLASASYFLFERYFLKLKERFSVVDSRPI